MSWDLWAIDALLLMLAGLAFFRGFRSGLVNQIVWLLSLVPAYFAGIRFCYLLYSLLGWELYNRNVTIAIWFVVAFSLVIVAMHYAGRVLTKLLNLSIVGIANSITGGMLNLAIGVVLLVVLVNLGSILFPGPIHQLEETVSVGVALRLERWFMDSRLLEMLEHNLTYLPDIDLQYTAIPASDWPEDASHGI